MNFLSRSLTMTALATLAALTQRGPRRGANTPVPAPAALQHDHLGTDAVFLTGSHRRRRIRRQLRENPRSPIHGTAVINPDGALSIGYTTSLSVSVYGRSDVGLQTNVEWPANSDVGSWTDDDGNSGTFLFEILDQKSG